MMNRARCLVSLGNAYARLRRPAATRQRDADEEPKRSRTLSSVAGWTPGGKSQRGVERRQVGHRFEVLAYLSGSCLNLRPISRRDEPR